MLAFSDWLTQHLGVSTGDSFFSVSTEERRSLGLNMCGACKLTCCISPEGGVYPCAFLQEADFRAGAVPGESFGHIWRHSPSFNLSGSWRSNRVDHAIGLISATADARP